MSSLLLFVAAIAPARAGTVERPTLPFHSVAGEDGVHVLYMNPALMSFDRDPGYGLYYDTQVQTGGLTSLALATTGSGLGAGVSYRQVAPDTSWWTLSSGLSLKLARDLSVGSTLHWQLPEGGDDNFVSWDLGAGWRPTPWLGFGGAIQNLGSPAPDLGVFTTYQAGLALRPFNDYLTLGADFAAVDPPDDPATSKIIASLRSRPVRGLWVRVYGERALTADAGFGLGASLELRFADLGFGVEGRSTTDDPSNLSAGGYIVTVEDDDQLFLPGRQVASFHLDQAYPYQPMGGLLEAPQESYLSLLRRIDSAAKDPQVKGILLDVDTLPFSFAQVEELRMSLTRARRNGKPVVVYLDQESSNAAYLLATAADRILLHPAGSLELVGLSAETQFYKGAMDLVGVQAQYAQRAEYKSGPEPMTRREASEPAREEMNALLDDLYATLVDGIAEGRKKTPLEVRDLIDRGPYTATEAVAAGLVDGLVYPDELRDKAEEVFPRGYAVDEGYAERVDSSGWEPARSIAVVVVDGPINSGDSSPGGFLSGAYTGSHTVVAALDEARRTPAVKAVVLRIDSPGGSAFASDEIWRAVERVKKAGKPVVVSMGGLAASGGYYAAAGADAIYALPSTITGSIGVYGGKINLGGLYEKLQITTESTDRGRNAGMYSSSRPFDPVEFAALDRMIEETYRQFKAKVETGRGMQPDEVELVARGRVWSGRDAKDKRLVDEFGGFYDALDRARSEAGMAQGAPYTVVTYDPWTGAGDEVPAQVVQVARQVARAVAPGPKIEMPAELEPFWKLAAFQDTYVFTLMPYTLELQ